MSYLTSKQVRERFNIKAAATLWRWQKPTQKMFKENNSTSISSKCIFSESENCISLLSSMIFIIFFFTFSFLSTDTVTLKYFLFFFFSYIFFSFTFLLKLFLDWAEFFLFLIQCNKFFFYCLLWFFFFFF